MTTPRPDGPTTASLPTLTADHVRALETFAQHCDTKADRARSLARVLTWRTTARLTRLYVRERS